MRSDLGVSARARHDGACQVELLFKKRAPHGGAKDDPRDTRYHRRHSGQDRSHSSGSAEDRDRPLGGLQARAMIAHTSCRTPRSDPATPQRRRHHGQTGGLKTATTIRVMSPWREESLSRPPSAHRHSRSNPQPVRRSLNPKAFTQKQYDASPHRKAVAAISKTLG